MGLDCCTKCSRIIRCSSPFKIGNGHILISLTAFRRISIYQGISLPPNRLQQSNLVPKFRSIDCWCLSLPLGIRTSRRSQDPYSEPEFREPREWIQDRFKHDEE